MRRAQTKGIKDLAHRGEDSTMLLRGLAALLFFGGIIYAMLSGNWGGGVIVFSVGIVVLGLDRLRVARSRPDRAIGWVLVLCGVLPVMFVAFTRAIGIT